MPNTYEIQKDYEAKEKANKKALKYLTSEQINLIKQTQNILDDVLSNIYDLQDISLSHIKELDSVYYRLKHKFNFDGDE